MECFPDDFEPLMETLKEEFPNHHIYGWDETFHFTVTPQEMHKLIRVYNAVMQKRLKDITFQDRKVVDRMRTLYRAGLDELARD